MTENSGRKQPGILASITAAIEAAQTEIRHVQIQTAAETYEAQVRLAIPLQDVSDLNRARIATDQVEFADDAVQFDLTIAIDGSRQPESRASESDLGDQAETRSDPNDGRDHADQGVRLPSAAQLDDSESDAAGNDESKGDDSKRGDTGMPPVAEPWSEQAGSDLNNEAVNDGNGSEEIPDYQDPEQLAAVYDDGATFDEMRRELGVDVTAQTVRKYMIKHGIHEPKPRPDRLLEAIRASELELMNSEEISRPSGSDESIDSDADGSQTD